MRMRHSFEDGMFVRELAPAEPLGTLVYIHGLGESGLSLEAIASRAELSRYGHLIPDLPGYGRSAWVEQVPSLAATADHLARWLSRRPRMRKAVYVVGHSMGAVVALMLAERHPRIIAGLIDVEGNKTAGDCVFSSQAASMPLERFEAVGLTKLRRRVYLDGLESAAHRGYYASLCLADPRLFHAHSVELVDLSSVGQLAWRLAKLPMPKAYVAGLPGGAPAESVQRVEGAGVDTIRIEPAGHWPFLDQPEAFARALTGLLGSRLWS